MDEVLPQLDELLFSSVEGVVVESVEVTETIVRVEARTTVTGQRQGRATRLDDYKPYLDQRWQEGCTNAWKLWEEIKEQGYPRGYASVRDYVGRTLRSKPQPVGPRPPSARAVTRWILTHPDALAEGRLQFKAALANCPELTALAEHVRSFAHMLTQLQGDRLPEWIEAAGAITEATQLSLAVQASVSRSSVS